MALDEAVVHRRRSYLRFEGPEPGTHFRGGSLPEFVEGAHEPRAVLLVLSFVRGQQKDVRSWLLTEFPRLPGAAYRSRTDDLLITNESLYQLS